MNVQVILGDITELPVDVVVNAANNGLMGGGGVDGAIHRAAGPRLREACKRLNGCKTGEVKSTPAFNMPAKVIYHAVGPVWQGGLSGEPELLKRCYALSLCMAETEGYTSIAFPAISCGVYGYPANKAILVVIEALKSFKSMSKSMGKVILCCFDEEITDIYKAALVNAGV